MSVISWMRARVRELPLPEPTKLPDPPALPRMTQDQRVRAEVIEAHMDKVFEANSRAALTSLAVSQEAITAEERTRSVLDGLMRDMDRGRTSGKR